MLTVKAVAKMLGVHETTVRKAAHSGKLKATTKKIGPKRSQMIMEEEDVRRWDKERLIPETRSRSYAQREVEVVEIPKCKLRIGTKVKYTKHGDGRSADNTQRGKIIDRTDHLIVVKNDQGFVECFSHFDYSRGEFKAV